MWETTHVDKDLWLTPICERFGISPAFFESMILFQANGKTLNIVNDDIVPVVRPVPASIGMPFLHIKMAQPKLTSAAAMWIGPACTVNVVELDASEANRFLRRETIALNRGNVESAGITRGYVMVRNEGLILGLGFFDGNSENPSLESFVPRAWAPGERTTML